MDSTIQQRQRRRMIFLCFVCCLVYFTSYMTRKSFSASLQPIMDDLGVARTALGLALTGSFVTYGIGQVVSGFLGDKLGPRVMIAIGLCGSGIVNLALTIASTPLMMGILLCINGFLQSMIWPPLVRAMSENFSLSFYSHGTRVVLTASACATAVTYALVSLCTKYLTWQSVFFFTSALGIGIAVLWFLVYGKYEKEPVLPAEQTQKAAKAGEPVPKKESSALAILLLSGGLAIMITTAFQGFLRDGVEDWMPTFLSDVYHLETSGAVLSVAILPALTVASYYFAAWMQKLTHSVLGASFAIFGIGTVVCGLLILFYSASPVVGIVCFAVLSGLCHAINLLLTSSTAVYYRRTGHVSAISGMINACTYIGSSVSSYGIADFSTKQSWSIVFFLFLAVMALGTLITAFAVRKWNCFAAQMQ